MNNCNTESSPWQSSMDHGGKVKVVAGFAIQSRLGSGSFATVYKGNKINTSAKGEEITGIPEGTEVVAIKAISRCSDKLTKKVLENLELEISILRNYHHENIVCLYNVQKTERHFFLILEYCGGGDLQRLIRTRKAGRLSETLSRRLMRDLSSGLRFLWSQELIHRDIKPQNLLLTGPLPLDEMNDPESLDENETRRIETNFPSSKFALKIADFGFARHLQSTSLAETLCGSPLYMAPEILQHHRYDAKADIWSVGTVLFEMIAGKPPFNGENHIDLLRNIQRKAVRLPNDVRVSKECVNLLRILLNRNPLSRAGYQDFILACDAFVNLGCAGTVQTESNGANSQIPKSNMDLGTIHEGKSDSNIKIQVEEECEMARINPIKESKPIEIKQHHHEGESHQSRFTPLQASPPQSTAIRKGFYGAAVHVPNLSEHISPQGQMQLMSCHKTFCKDTAALQHSTDDSEFVMVEHSTDTLIPLTNNDTRLKVTVNDGYKRSGSLRGILSTSPGTGGMLINLMGMGSRPRLVHQNSFNKPIASLDAQFDSATKMVATAEDVGRRAISVAHLGDARAYIAMRSLTTMSFGSSFYASFPMDGIEETKKELSQNNISTGDQGSFRSDEVSEQYRRRSSSADKSMAETSADEENNDDEMPFVMTSDSFEKPKVIPMPSRGGTESLLKKRSLISLKSEAKCNPKLIRLRFAEALISYLKALSMIKSVLEALQKVKKDLDFVKNQGQLNVEQDRRLNDLLNRFKTTSKWLSNQFSGVLERADAANMEITKFPTPKSDQALDSLSVTDVKKLIFNHSIACGRDGAVKQLLGQFEMSRSCYRTAGLLIETLLMEPNVSSNDRETLEGYVEGFSARIHELDYIILEQNRMDAKNQNSEHVGGLSLIKNV